MSKQSPIFGIDISGWQPADMDMAQAKSEGYEFCVVKATEGPHPDGRTYDNVYYEKQLQNARDAGMVVGAYHYLVEADAKAQVDHFLEVVGDVEGLLLQIDYEEYNHYPDLSPRPSMLDAFVVELKARIGSHPILLYSSRGYWYEEPPNGDVTDSQIVTWDANYPYEGDPRTGPELYAEVWDWDQAWGERWGGREPMFWQFTGSTPVANVAQVDVNAFRGTREQLLALTGAEERDYWVGFTADQEQWLRGVNVPRNAWVKPTQSGGKVWLELVPPGAAPAGAEYQTYGWVGFTREGRRMRGVNVPRNAWIKPTEQGGKVWLELVPPEVSQPSEGVR
jgi:GH25 family lysozyme M1 (1,4-beta-N-acetylmuramidase)